VVAARLLNRRAKASKNILCICSPFQTLIPAAGERFLVNGAASKNFGG
jgi:hypothetical protein